MKEDDYVSSEDWFEERGREGKSNRRWQFRSDEYCHDGRKKRRSPRQQRRDLRRQKSDRGFL